MARDGTYQSFNMLDNRVFDPFLFNRVEIQESGDQIMLDRLALHIEEFKDLAKIEDWKSISNDPAVYTRLQKAHNIMHDYYYPDLFLKQYRCRPCEMEGLCAIKHLIKKQELI